MDDVYKEIVENLPYASLQPEPYEELDFVQEHKKIPVVLDIQQKGKSMPSAQPEQCEDAVSRKAAIDAAVEAVDKWYGKLDPEREIAVTRAILALPSAQPEIIFCEDCKYKDDGIDEDGIPFLKCLNGRSYGGTRINDFCSWAERKQDAVD